MANKHKIINDPVFGFIRIPDELIFDVLQHPYMQRLNRIRQLGMSYYVYPGAHHNRFLHSLGAMHLMDEALNCLVQKNVPITEEEKLAAMLGILMHDIGHGPFSHVMEHTLVEGVTHEDISLMMMQQINQEMNGRLDLAIRIFKGDYHKPYLHQLISSQLDVDRLDYLCRDSFFCGVTEGSVASARLLKMMHVAKDGNLVIEAKGIYSVEKFLIARRLMYWQVYLHKTSVAAEQMLLKILHRAKCLASRGEELFCSPSLHYFLYNHITADSFQSPEALQHYAQLDDSDVLSAIKVWMGHEDKVLSTLCKGLINRVLFKTRVLQEPLTDEEKQTLDKTYSEALAIPLHEAQYFYEEHISTSKTYSNHGTKIGILFNDGSIRDIAEASEILDMKTLTQKPEKRYLLTFPLG